MRTKQGKQNFNKFYFPYEIVAHEYLKEQIWSGQTCQGF